MTGTQIPHPADDRGSQQTMKAFGIFASSFRHVFSRDPETPSGNRKIAKPRALNP